MFSHENCTTYESIPLSCFTKGSTAHMSRIKLQNLNSKDIGFKWLYVWFLPWWQLNSDCSWVDKYIIKRKRYLFIIYVLQQIFFTGYVSLDICHVDFFNNVSYLLVVEFIPWPVRIPILRAWAVRFWAGRFLQVEQGSDRRILQR